jgi:hypothetical protein
MKTTPRSKTMKRFIYTAALAAAMACPYGYAQTVDARANVPFNFRMGDAVMPAGKYRIHESQGLLMLSEETGKKAAMHLTLPVSRPAIASNPSLEFRRYGNEYYLAKVWSGQSRDGHSLIQGKREKELAARFRNIEPANTVLEARSK